MERLKTVLTAHKITVILVISLIVLIFGGYFLFQKFTAQNAQVADEVDLAFDAEGPYAQLFPRRDGNALVLNLQRTASYDAISYELAYTSNISEVATEGNKTKIVGDDGEAPQSGSIDRGVAGTIDTKDKKGGYEQEILFGTCSKNVCKYDTGVENGTLTLHIKKGNKAYKMVTQWHLQKPDVALGILTSGDGHFSYKMTADRQTLSGAGFTIVNDLTGVPKLPSDKQVEGKVYSLNAPIAKSLPNGEVTLELAENPQNNAKIYRFDGSNWKELDTKVEGSKLFAKVDGAGLFTVLTSK